MGAHCRDCGFDNPENERFCQACNADLLHQDLVSGNGTERQTGRYRAIKEAADKTLNGDWTIEQFGEYLQQTSAQIQENANTVMRNVEDSQYDKESPEEVAAGLDGIRLYEEGLHELWLYTQDRDPLHLEAGLGTCWEGNEKMILALKLNREARQNLLEELTRLHEEL